MSSAKLELLVVLLALLVTSASCGASQCERMDADVLILGAGIAGLGAAETLSKNGVRNFLIIEQRDVVGGRIESAKLGGATVELGAQWLLMTDFNAPEDIQNPLIPLFDRCNITIRPLFLGGLPPISYNSLGEDITSQVQEALGRYQVAVSPDTLQNIFAALPDDVDVPATQGLRMGGWNARSQLEEHAEGLAYDVVLGLPTDLGSYRDTFDPELFALRNEFGPAANNYIITHPEGYVAMPQCFAREFLEEYDPRLILSTTIVEVIWGDECICAVTEDGTQYCALYAIITFSVGSLQNRVVRFTPDLPLSKMVTLNRFEMANFLKIFIEFNETFWDTEADFITYLDEGRSREYYTTFVPWGSYFPEQPPILETILTGNEAKRVAYQDLSITKQEIADVMRNIYGELASDPVDIIMHDFIVNAHFFGDFSAAAVNFNQSLIDEINEPCGNLYFGGEAYRFLHHSNVHGALIQGRETAERIVRRLPLQITFINDTPRVVGNTVTADFNVLGTATTVECIIGSWLDRKDCSSGTVTFTDLEDGTYKLRVIASRRTESAVASAKVTVTSGDACAANLINDGVSVLGARATVEFTSSGLPVQEFRCTLDGVKLNYCESPLVLSLSTEGRHYLKIIPMCAGTSIKTVAIIDIDL